MTKEVINNNFEVPSWAGKPTAGLHLDVMKDGKLIQKLMIDEKKCYFFGRNKESCDFQIDHQSCSRVHAALVWHKNLNRLFLIDLGSTHGTFVGNIRLEPNKPQQIFTDSELKFGASTRSYIIKEKPQTSQSSNLLSSSLLNGSNINNPTNNNEDDNDNLNLPQSEAELDNLTEFNTAHNRRISQIVTITDSATSLSVNSKITAKKKRKNVGFNEEVQVLNPEDIDPSIGKFRNLVQTTYVIPNKKRATNEAQLTNSTTNNQSKKIKFNDNDDSENYSSYDHEGQNTTLFNRNSFEIASKLGIKLPDLAPNVNNKQLVDEPRNIYNQQHNTSDDFDDDIGLYEQPHKKKKYAKEAWPGRKSTLVSSATTNDSFNLF